MNNSNYNMDNNNNYGQLNQDTNYIEMLEIDEKVPQEKLNQIEERRNKVNIYINFPFNYFFEQEKEKGWVSLLNKCRRRRV